MAGETRRRRRRRGDYGFDAPLVPAIFGTLGVAGLIGAAVNAHSGSWTWAGITAAAGAYMLASAASSIYTTRWGRFAVWADILGGIGLRGDERVLDMGCGRGAVLVLVAERLTGGRAVGLDLWRTAGRSGNRAPIALRNAALEGVADRVLVVSGDMRTAPLREGTFDLVVSSLAVHDIKDAAGRERAVEEAIRVLRPGGRLAVADQRHTREYAAIMTRSGMERVLVTRLDWRFWYSGPWTATRLVLAAKPAGAAPGGRSGQARRR